MQFLSRRFASLVLVLLGLSIFAFSLANLTPGDPAERILQQRGDIPTREAVEQLREELGLNAPFTLRYARWLGNTLRGDLGASYRTGAPVLGSYADRFGATLQLAAGALVISLLVSLPLGVLAAVRRDSWVDHFTRLISLLGTSIPSFVLGYALILFFGVTLNWLPVTGAGGWRYLVLPVVTLGLSDAASLMRLTRANMLETLGEDYVRTARAKGVAPPGLFLRHALRNALNPIVTLAGMRVGRLLGGAVIVETIFARPGIGQLIVDSIHDRDYPMIQGFVLFMGTMLVLANFVVDLSYAALDPRIRLGGHSGENARPR